MRKKKINIVPIYKETFTIPQIPKIIGLRGKTKKEKTPFISPIFGDYVKDVTVNPVSVKREGDFDKQYDAFRDTKLSDEEKVAKYGHKYYEFTNIITREQRHAYYGKNERELRHEPQPITEEKPVIRPIYHEEPIYQDTPVPNEVFETPIKIESTFDSPEVDEPSVYTYPSSEAKETPLATPAFHQEKKISPYQVKTYLLPSAKLFSKRARDTNAKPEWLLDQIETINQTMIEFGIEAEVKNSKKGPTVTRYELSVNAGVNVKRVASIQDTLMMKLAATSLRIEAPIPGKPYVGLEVPNRQSEIVAFGNVVDTPEFLNDYDHPLKVALGVDIDGENIYVDIAKMPHGLIAGATNSGKSVCVNTILISLLLKNKPEDLKLILIDPKMVELSTYNDLPHLITPVITDAKMAASALTWSVDEMERRYQKFANTRSRDIKSYNEGIAAGKIDDQKMPFLVIVIDELADLMMVAAHDVEDAIQRITQKARAAGIHLLVATQRPTTDVVKGTIKSNIPTRIAFKVASFTDSTTILDGAGAEQLLGKGDMLLKETNQAKRLQGAFIPTEEIDAVTDFIRLHSTPKYVFEHEELKIQLKIKEAVTDDLFQDVAYFVVRKKNASINSIQTEFNIGFNRAKRLVEMLVDKGIVSDEQGPKAKEVLVDEDDLEVYFNGSLT